MAFHDPFNGGLAVDDVVVGFQRDVADGDVLVVDDRGFVFDALLRFRVFDVGELHFADVEVFVFAGLQGCRAAGEVERDGMLFDGFVVEVPVREVSTGPRERLKILELLHRRNAGQFFAEIVLEPLAILRRMQQAVDVLEEVFFGDGVRGIRFYEVVRTGRGERISTCVI